MENGKEVWEDVEELKSLTSYFSLSVLTAQSHLLRKVVDPATGRLYLGLFLYLAENTQVIENSNYICTTITALILPLKMCTISFRQVLILGSLHNSLGCVLKYGGCFACGGYSGKMDLAMNWLLVNFIN